MDLFELAAKIKLDDSDYEKGLGRAEKQGKNFADSMDKTLKRIQKAAKWIVGGYAIKKIADTFIMPAKNAYAQYEQLVGGVDTLFKEASVFVQQNAAKAFKSAGISANEYMELATSFSASLIQSLGGDTMQAAKVADRAIIDMSDNANKMGTDIQSIQNAYRGFSKQNYTMLDNLKLGYGGTKSEMERLIKDAASYTDIQKELGVTVDASSMSFANIVNAISVVQKKLDIAGTTAAEAEGTITGSFGMVKASWQDLLVAMADPKGNIKFATNNFINSGKKMLENTIPIIKQAISGLGDFIAEVAPMIGEELPKLIIDFLPQFLKAGKNLAQGLWKGIKSAWKKIDWKGLASTIWKGIQNGISDLGGLIFGKNKDGSVNWPTWNSVKSFAIEKWEEIKAGAAGIVKEAGKLIFGADDKGEVNWPSWSDVQKFAEAKWKDIKRGAAGIMHNAGRLIFGADDKGEVNWPTWNQVVDKANEIWEDIKAGALTLAGLVFGKKDDGTVNWPSVDYAIAWAKTNIWDKIVAAVGNFFGLIFGKNNDGTVNWPNWYKLYTWAKENIWDNIVKAVSNLGGLIFGRDQDGKVNWPNLVTLISWAKTNIWDKLVEYVADLGGLIFGRDQKGDVKWPSWNDISASAVKAWEDIKAEAAKLIGIDDIARYFDSIVAAVGTFALVTKVSSLFNAIKTGLAGIGAISTTGKVALILSAVAGLVTLIASNWDVVGPFFEQIKEAIISVGNDIYDYIVVPLANGAIDFVNVLIDGMNLFGANIEKIQRLETSWERENREAAEKKEEERQAKARERTAESAKEAAKTLYDTMFEQYVKSMEKSADKNATFQSFREIIKKMFGGDDAAATAILTWFDSDYLNGNSDHQKGYENLERWIKQNPNYSSWLGGLPTESAIEQILRTYYGSALTYMGANGKGEGTLSGVVEAAQKYVDEHPVKGVIDYEIGHIEVPEGHGGSGGSFAKGAWDIPYDQTARVHANEMILNATQARQYREGNAFGGTSDIIAALHGLRQDMQNIQLVVGEKALGRATVQYGGNRMNGYIGKSERRVAAGYGWG